MSKQVIIYTDGGCRYNPGPAAIGVVIQDASGIVLAAISDYIGQGTNNQAEYQAVIAGLERAQALGASNVEIRTDSQLISEQMNGRYKVKDAALKPLFQKAQALSRRFQNFKIVHIPREKNREADRLVGMALSSRGAGKPESASVVRQATFDL